MENEGTRVQGYESICCYEGVRHMLHTSIRVRVRVPSVRHGLHASSVSRYQFDSSHTVSVSTVFWDKSSGSNSSLGLDKNKGFGFGLSVWVLV